MSVSLSPEYYQTILDELPNGVYVVDEDHKIIFWNQGAQRITGYASNDVLGRYCHQNLLNHCDHNFRPLCGDQCPMRLTMLDGREREATVYLRHKNGQRVPVKIHAKPVRSPEGTIIGAVETFDECQEMSELQMHPNGLAVQFRRDQQTGLCDQLSTTRYLEACLRDYRDDRVPFGVLLVSVDGLEELRRSHGAQGAANVIRTVGVTLAKNLRTGDVVGAWSDDRFVIAAVNCPPLTLAQLIFHFKRIISITEIPWWGDRLTVTVSIGGTVVRPDDTVEALLSRCDRALLGCAAHGGDGGDVI